MDRISELPEGIIERILYLLTATDAAQTSILSKKWLHLWHTRSVLDFHQRYFRNRGSTRDKDEGLNKLIEFVDNTLIRHHQHGICIQEFKLSISLRDRKFYSLIDKWLKIAVDNKVGVLNLWINRLPLWDFDSAYVVPNQIFEAKSLIDLQICGNSPYKLSLDNTILKCHDLKKLKLSSINVDDRSIQNIICNCPLIEEFCLVDVNGLGRVCVVGLSNLKIFSIATFTKLKEICIQAPMLQSCVCTSESDSVHCFNLDPSQNLKFLKLSRVNITDMDFNKLLSQSPYLESLSLFKCNMLEKINVSSHSLKQFILSGGKKLKLVEVIIDCPNLLSLDYRCPRLSQLSFASPLAQGKPEIHISFDGHMDFSRFYELRKFLTKFNVSSVGLDITSAYLTFTEEWRAVSLPPAHEVEILKLAIYSFTMALRYPIFLDGLFWSCHPKTISLDGSRSSEDFIKFLCKELMERGDANCCSYSGIKCWRHHLLYLEIKSFDWIQMEWKRLSWNDIADGQVTLEAGQKICLTMEWSELVLEVDKVKEVDEQKQKMGVT